MKNKYLMISLLLCMICFITWQSANYFSAPGEMDRMTSIAIMGFLGTVLFVLTTVVLLLGAILTKFKN